MESQFIALDLSKIPNGTVVKRDGNGFIGVPTDDLNENESGSSSGSGNGSGSGGGGETSASAWLTGSAIPSSSLGDELDFYIRSNGYLYQKVGGGWLLLAQLKGETGANGATGPAGANGAAGATGAAGPAGATGSTGATGPAGATGEAGDDGLNGWTPIFALKTDSERRVIQVVDWTGGSGTKPTSGVYVGTSGYVSSITDAVNVRGAAGATGAAGTNGTNGVNGLDGDDGTNGWSPIFSVVPDGEKRVQRVSDWVGGTGSKPASGVYVGATGLVGNIADAVDIRGAAGADGEGGGSGGTAELAIAWGGDNYHEKLRLVQNGVSVVQPFGIRVFGSSEVFDFRADISNTDLRDGILGLAAIANLPLEPTLEITGTLDGTTEISGAREMEFGEYQNVPQLQIVSGCVDVFTSTAAEFAVNGGEPMEAGVSQADFQANQRALGGAFSDVVCIGESSGGNTGFTLFFPYDVEPDEPFCTETDSGIYRQFGLNDTNGPLTLETVSEGASATGRAGLLTPIQARNLESLQSPVDGYIELFGVGGASVGTINLNAGWFPMYGIVSDGQRRVMKIAGWFGGVGEIPFPQNIYVGENGFVLDIAEAVDISGGAGGTPTEINVIAGKTAFNSSTNETTSILTDGDTETGLFISGVGPTNNFRFEFEDTVLISNVRVLVNSGGQSAIFIRSEENGDNLIEKVVNTGTTNLWVECLFGTPTVFGPEKPLWIAFSGMFDLAEIEAIGIVGQPSFENFLGAMVTRDTAEPIVLTAESGFTSIAFPTVSWDEGSFTDPDQPLGFRVPLGGDGYYLINAMVVVGATDEEDPELPEAVPPTTAVVALLANSFPNGIIGADTIQIVNSGGYAMKITQAVQLVAGDIIGLAISKNGEATLTIPGDTLSTFSITKLGGTILGGGGGAVDSVNGETGAVVLSGANLEVTDPTDAISKPLDDIVATLFGGLSMVTTELPVTIQSGVVDYIQNTFIGAESDLEEQDGNAVLRPTGTAAGTFTNATVTTNLKGQITAIESGPDLTNANVMSAKSLVLTGNVALDFDDLAQYLHVTGTLSGDTYIELPTPATQPYALHIRNATTGGDLYVQKSGGADATQILSGQTMIVMVTV